MYHEMRCGIVGLQETRRSGQSAVSSEATEEGRRAKVELDWLFAKAFPVPKYDRHSSSATGY